jgi:hypothetical protein
MVSGVDFFVENSAGALLFIKKEKSRITNYRYTT